MAWTSGRGHLGVGIWAWANNPDVGKYGGIRRVRSAGSILAAARRPGPRPDRVRLDRPVSGAQRRTPVRNRESADRTIAAVYDVVPLG